MTILHRDNGQNGIFYIEQDHQIVAEMTYKWAGSTQIIIDHTEVSDLLRGTGAGKQLVARAVEFARQKGIKIIPLCPFAKSVLEKNTDYADVL